jgi:hypothetical protein
MQRLNDAEYAISGTITFKGFSYRIVEFGVRDGKPVVVLEPGQPELEEIMKAHVNAGYGCPSIDWPARKIVLLGIEYPYH